MPNSRSILSITILLLAATVATSRQPGAVQPDPKKQAERFARLFYKAMKIIREEHVNTASEPQMIRWGLRSLFSSEMLPLPEQIAQGISNVEKKSPSDRLKLAVNAHLLLGGFKKPGVEKDLEAALNAILRNLEPGVKQDERSQYLPSNFVRNIQCVGISPFGSIGVVVKGHPTSGYLKIITPIFNGPAYKAGLGGDLITHIRIKPDSSGKPLPQLLIYSTKGMSAKRAESLLAGIPGTRIRLTVIPAGSAVSRSSVNSNPPTAVGGLWRKNWR